MNVSGECVQADKQPFTWLQDAWKEQRMCVWMRRETGKPSMLSSVLRKPHKLKFGIVSVMTLPMFRHVVLLSQAILRLPFCLVGIGWWMKSNVKRIFVCVCVCVCVCVYTCQSPNSSHPLLPPWYPYICSPHLCLCFCFANKIIYKATFQDKQVSP